MDYDDPYELEQDLHYKNCKSPFEIMVDTFHGVYHRDWKLYLESIEWDGLWLRHDTLQEKIAHFEKKQKESHPFKKFIY
jgi:hypothetical protein